MASLTVLSRPHPNAFNRALTAPDGEQKRRSSHHWWFLEADATARILARRLPLATPAAQGEQGVRRGNPEYVGFLGNPSTDGSSAYLVSGAGRDPRPIGVIKVPTLFIWGNADDTVGRMAAEGTEEFVASAYRFVELPGVGHFVVDQAPDQVIALLLDHLAAHPA